MLIGLKLKLFQFLMQSLLLSFHFSNISIFQVIFCNNPWSGFLVLFALYYADFTVGLATTLAASTAILTAFVRKDKCLRHDYDGMNMTLVIGFLSRRIQD